MLVRVATAVAPGHPTRTLRLIPSPEMTFLAAAGVVLKAAKRPMTCREITERALKRGLIRPTGKTPEATMSATLYSAVKADPEGAIRREYEPGPTRAAWDSVRWIWTGRYGLPTIWRSRSAHSPERTTPALALGAMQVAVRRTYDRRMATSGFLDHIDRDPTEHDSVRGLRQGLGNHLLGGRG